jgi:hypothetical protein
MASSAPAPPGGRPPAAGEEDETEMTSIMDADQRRELQRAAREAAQVLEPERETARPPPEHEALATEELAIPKAAAVPAEARVEAPVSRPPAQAPEAAPASAGLQPWMWIAFALLLAAVAFALRA